MVLSNLKITSVSPRGGSATTTVTVTGSGFLVTQGTVTFDPLGQNGGPYPANILSWLPTEIQYEVPAALSTNLVDNRFYDVLIRTFGDTDSIQHMFWIPSTSDTAATPTLPVGLDYQWPDFEENTEDQDTDNPRRIQASDLNRILAKIGLMSAALGAGTVLPPLTGVPTGYVLTHDPNGQVNWRPVTGSVPAFNATLSGGGVVEVGVTVASPQVSASYNRSPVEASISDSEGLGPIDVLALPNPITLATSYRKTANNDSVTITLSARENPTDSFDTSAVSYVWRPRVFFGVGPAGQSSEAFLESLANQPLAANRIREFTLSPGAGQKMYYAYPTAYGAATFFVGAFEGGFVGPTVVSVTNDFGVTQDYNVYETVLENLGTTTVRVA